MLLCGDTSAKEKGTQKNKNKASHSAALLVGDGGAATLLEKNKSCPEIIVSSKTNGEGYKAIISPYGQWRHPNIPEGSDGVTLMDDIVVFNFATDEAVRQINEYLQYTNSSPEDYDCLALHQANLLILKRIAKKTGFPTEKNLISIDKFANTSSASIPISLVNAYGDINEEKKLHVLCCGFGVGLSWATMAVEIDTNSILPLQHTDEYYDDKYLNN